MDMKVSGSSVLPGGEYGKVSLSGATVISGDIVCDSLTANGALKCEAVECRGDITLSGSLSCSAIQCGSVSIRGKAEIEKGITSENFVMQGAIICNGLLYSERVSIVVDGKNEILAIKGGSVSMTKKALALFPRNACVTSAVEGNDVSLSYVTCPRVSGARVVIGKGCEIDLVQYSETVEISSEAKVIKIEKI